ncbi:MAG: universal stress protein [Chloroflexi bacterium]|nr:universal stress protein [Chloroflexota bacterium]
MHIKRLLLPIKGQRVDQDTLRFASNLVRHEHGSICLLYVIEVPRQYPIDAELPSEVAKCEEVLKSAQEFMKSQKVKVETEMLQARDAGPAIVQEAQERGVDAMLLGLNYKRRHDSLTLGGVTPYIIEHALCPVLVYREAKPDEAAPKSRETATSGAESRQ